jgi:hypothetical protein
LLSLTGDDNKRYDELKQGTSYYTETLAHAIAAKAIAADAGLAYRILGVCAVHGEADQAFSRTDYGPHLTEWQLDYDADLAAISEQLEVIPLFVGQQAGYAPDSDNGAAFAAASALELEEAHTIAPDRVVIVSPQYFLDYVDQLHFCAESHRLLGEYFARAIERVSLHNEVFHGLAPAACSLSDDTITINFDVPVPPIAFDFTRVLYQPGCGFAFDDADHSASVASVAITGPAQVTITLTNAPTGANPEIRYGCDTFNGSPWPKFGGGKGNLRDSEAGTSNLGESLFNFCVQFRRSL